MSETPKIDWSAPDSPMKSSGFYDTAYRKAIEEAVDRLMYLVSELTKDQFVEVIRQALICGDLMRHVRVDGAQAVTYLPYRREQELEERIKELESQVLHQRTAKLDRDGIKS